MSDQTPERGPSFVPPSSPVGPWVQTDPGVIPPGPNCRTSTELTDGTPSRESSDDRSRKSRPGWLLPLVVGLAVLLVLVILGALPKQSSGSDDVCGPQWQMGTCVEAGVLIAEFEAGLDAAQTKYRGDLVYIKAVMSIAEVNETGDFTAVFHDPRNSGFDASAIGCRDLPGADVEAWKSTHQGWNVVVSGRVTGSTRNDDGTVLIGLTACHLEM